MIERFTQDEIKELIEELTGCGLLNRTFNKAKLLQEESNKLGFRRLFVSSELCKNLYDIADYLTKNYIEGKTNGKKRKYKSNAVPKEKEEEYRRILSALLEAIKPYCGMEGFRENIIEGLE